MIDQIAPPSRSMHVYEVRPRKGHRGVDLIWVPKLKNSQ